MRTADKAWPSPDSRGPSGLQIVGCALLCWALWLLVRSTAPEDLCTRDQERAAAYVLDITENGNWLLQRDFRGAVASKPPLPNWLAATASLAAGRVERLWLAFPAWLSTALVSLAIAAATARFAGRRAALFVVPLYLGSQLGLRQVYLVRSDPVFQCGVTFASLAMFRWWTEGRGQIAFGVAATVAVLAKGPLGILLAVSGLLAVWWDRRTVGRDLPRSRTRIARFPALPTLLGVGLPLVVPALWFVAADLSSGGAAWAKLIDDELLGHAQGKGGRVPFERPLFPWLWFLSRAAPAGLLAAFAIARLVRHPDADPTKRRFERFLTSWIVTLLVLLTIVGNKRFVHLLPVLPPAAILAARALDRSLPARLLRRPVRLAIVGSLIAASIAAVYLNHLDKNEDLDKARCVREVVHTVESRLGRDFPIHVSAGAPDLALIDLDRHVPMVDRIEILDESVARGADRIVVHREESLALLRSDDAAFLLTIDPEAYERALGDRVHRVLQRTGSDWPGTVAIVSNRDRLAWPESGPIRLTDGRSLEVTGGRVVRFDETDLRIDARSADAALILRRVDDGPTGAATDAERIPLLPWTVAGPGEVVRTSIDPQRRRPSGGRFALFLLVTASILSVAALAAARTIDRDRPGPHPARRAGEIA